MRGAVDGAEVGLGLDDAAGEAFAVELTHQVAPQQIARHLGSGAAIEDTGKGAPHGSILAFAARSEA